MLSHLLRTLGALILTLVFMLGFATFGYAAANIEMPMDPNFPLPEWWITACMAVICLTCLIGSIGSVFMFMNELHLWATQPKRNPRYKVTWRESSFAER